jgi:hypothetical protein
LIAGVMPAPLAAQPLAVDQMSAAQAVAQHRVRPLNGAQPFTLTTAPHVVGRDVDQLNGLCFPAAEDGQG